MNKWLESNWFKVGVLAVIVWSSCLFVRAQENIGYANCDLELVKSGNWTADNSGLCSVIVSHKFEFPWEPATFVKK